MADTLFPEPFVPVVSTVLPSLAAASEQEVQNWSSSVLSYKLHVHHTSADKNSSQLIYHLQCELERPIPYSYLKVCREIAFAWPVGGIWKVTKVDDDNKRVWCQAHKNVELSAEEIDSHIKQFKPADPDMASAGELPSVAWPLFSWKMQLGTWEKHSHWFLRANNSPPLPVNADPAAPAPLMTAKLLAGLTPVRAQLLVHSITSVETVQQTFTADVVWEVTIPGITTISEDTVFQEMVDLMQFKEEDFEFTNATEIKSQREVESFVIPAGRAKFDDAVSLDSKEGSETVYHLRFRRRMTAVFNEEMSLYYFPFDQQKLTFSFSMTYGLGSQIPIAPYPIDAGTFSVTNFKLGNVFKVVYGDKVFVGEVTDNELEKIIRFEVVLERFSAYYITNVAVPPAIITYLIFTSWAPQQDNTLMDLGNRLQIIMTLVLTTVTFKNMVAELIPQVSYFTWLDRYVFFCYIVQCVATFESSFYPLIYIWAGSPTNWDEKWLLGFSMISFTLASVGWGLYLLWFVRTRTYRSQILSRVHEYVRVIEHAIPNEYKDQVLRGYLEMLQIKAEDLPEIAYTKHGDQYVVLPSDSPTETRAAKRHKLITRFDRKKALRDLPSIQQYYKSINPLAVTPTPSPAPSPAMTKNKTSLHYSGKHSSKYVVVDVDTEDELYQSLH